MRPSASNPHHREFWPLDRFVAVMVASAEIVLDEHAPARQREQARRRIALLHREASARWPALFTDEKGS